MPKRNSRRKCKKIESFFEEELYELSASDEMDFFYRQSVRLKSPQLMPEKPVEVVKDSQMSGLYKEISLAAFEIPSLSPEQFKQNIVDLLYILRQRKAKNH